LSRRPRRGQRIGGGDRIGGVGVDQHLRALAAHQPAREVRRDGDHELHLAALQELVGLGLALGPMGEAHVAGVAERREDGARDLALVGRQHGGRQMMRVGVDGIAEQQELQDRHAEHHGEGQPVAAKLPHFLGDHGREPPPEAAQPHGQAPLRRDNVERPQDLTLRSGPQGRVSKGGQQVPRLLPMLRDARCARSSA